mgnify:FL=1
MLAQILAVNAVYKLLLLFHGQSVKTFHDAGHYTFGLLLDLLDEGFVLAQKLTGIIVTHNPRFALIAVSRLDQFVAVILSAFAVSIQFRLLDMLAFIFKLRHFLKFLRVRAFLDSVIATCMDVSS